MVFGFMSTYPNYAVKWQEESQMKES